MPTRSVVFDVVGTCFSYEAGAEALNARLGDKLIANGISYKLLFEAWMASAERDAAYLSAMKKYTVFEAVLKASFFRTLYLSGISSPHDIATPSDVDHLIAEYRKLQPRPGLAQMLRDLREAGFEVWCATDASHDRVKGYFDAAGIDMPGERILSTDSVGAGKPEPPIYLRAREKAGADVEGSVAVFAAAHSWDVCAARAVGFNTAYCTIYEKDGCEAIYGKADVVADDLPGLAKAIIEKWGGER